MKKILLLSLILVLSCNRDKEANESERIEKNTSEFNLTKSDFVILTYQANWHWTFKNVKPAKLSQLELIEIEHILKIAIKDHNEIQKKVVIEQNKYPNSVPLTKTGYELKLEGYKRQYVPIINKKGQKEVWINFFCNDMEDGAFGDEKWRTALVLVEDGGNCFYHIKINLNTKKYYELEVNYDV